MKPLSQSPKVRNPEPKEQLLAPGREPRPAPGALRALCPGLPRWETVQVSPNQKWEQLQEDSRRTKKLGVECGMSTQPCPAPRAGYHHSRARTHAPPAEATRPGPQGLALASSALLARPSRPTAALAASAVGAYPSTPLSSCLIKKKQLRGAALPCSSSLRAPNPGMVGRWHARFCQEPLHW